MIRALRRPTQLVRVPLVCALMMLLIAACGSGSESATEATDEPVPSPAPTTTPTAAPTTAPTLTVEPTAEPVPAPTTQPTAVAAEAEADPDTVPVAEVVPVVYAQDYATSIEPIFADHCASCHNAGGPGAIHWRLDTAADLVATHEWIAQIVDVGYMPPWPASDLSLEFHENRSLRPDEIEAIRAWSSDGAPLDVEPTSPVVAAQGVDALEADVEIGPHEPFQGSRAVVDDYRCFVYELGVDQQRWLEGFEFVPDEPSIVHHALGYLLPAAARDQAQVLSDEDDLGGWQCYGGSRLRGDELFLGWAPGQLPTRFPDGTGLRVDAGDFMVLQVHYHFDTPEAPEDASTIRLDWADSGEDLDPIEFDEFIGPAEIPCSSDETGPLCDRSAALAQAYQRYGVEGVLADGINQLCGVTPEDFAHMTNGIASSECTIPVRHFGEIVSVFGHQHEIGKSIRMTLNAGTSGERILLDIPDWTFDWQYNYRPSEAVVLQPGDTILLECTWDRSRRRADLEPAYVLWADGTNDEMCFATISTRRMTTGAEAATSDESETPVAAPVPLLLDALPEDLATCLRDAGVAADELPGRADIDTTADALFMCDAGGEGGRIGAAFSDIVTDTFGGFVDDAGRACLANALATPEATRDLLLYLQPDSTTDERLPLAQIVGDCVSLSGALEVFGFPLPDSARDCIDEAGRDLLVQATLDQELPEEQLLFGAINPCLSGG